MSKPFDSLCEMIRRNGQSFERLFEKIDRHPKIFLTIIALLLAVQIGPWWYSSFDGTNYVSIARSINIDGEMSNLGGHVDIPVGYPVLLTPAFSFGWRPFVALSVIQWLLAIVLMFGVYHWAWKQFPSMAVSITTLTMVHAGLWLYYRRTLKEIAFLAVLIWTVNVLQALVQQRSVLKTVLLGTLAASLLVYLTMIRYAGVVLVAGFGMSLLIMAWHGRTSWTRAIGLSSVVGLPAVLLLGSVLLHQKSVAETQGGRDYLKGLTEPQSVQSQTYPQRISNGLRLRVSEIGRLTVPGLLKATSSKESWLDINTLVHIPIVLILSIGWWKLASDRRDVLSLTFPFYVGLCILWPFDGGTRFLFPMLPLLMAALAYAIRRITLLPPTVTGVFLVGHASVAIFYWVLIDLPRTVEANNDWPIIEQVAGELDLPVGSYATLELSGEKRAMLQLETDLPIPDVRSREQIGSHFSYLITPADAPVIENFAPSVVVGSIAIQKRIDSEAVPANLLRTAEDPGADSPL